MNSELGRIWKDAVTAWFDILHRHFLGRTEENYNDTFNRLVTLQDEFDTVTFRIQRLVPGVDRCLRCVHEVHKEG